MRARASARRASEGASRLLWLGVIVWAAALSWYVAANVAGVEAPPPWSQFAFVDFRDTIYVPTRDLAAGNNPYAPHEYHNRYPNIQMFNPYFPQHFFFFGWLAALPIHLAVPVMTVGTVAATSWLVRQGLQETTQRTARWIAPAVVLLLLVRGPGLQAIRQGQTAVILAACAWYAVTRVSRPWLQALAVALTLCKPQLGLAVLMLATLRFGWKVLVRSLLVTSLTALPATILLLSNAGGPAALADSLRANVAASSTDQGFLGGPADVATCIQALYPAAPSVATTLAMIGTAVAVAALGWVSSRPQCPASGLTKLWVLGLALVMILPNQRYALAVLVPVVLLTFQHCWASARLAIWPLLAALLAAYAMVRSESVERLAGIPGNITSAMTGICLVFALVACFLACPRRAASS